MGGAKKLVVRERRMWVEYKERKEVWVGRIKKRKRRGEWIECVKGRGEGV